MTEEQKPPDSPPAASAVKRYTLRSKPSTEAERFSIDYAAELNAAQLEAVRSIEGPHLIIAGAGSGKTRTLIYRVAYLVEKRTPPEQILLLTFTRRAAQEMMRRAGDILDHRCRNIRGGTFHSYASAVLRKYAGAISYDSNFTIVDRGDAEDIINILRTEMGLTSQEMRFPKKNTILSAISKSVNTGLPLDSILKEDYPQFVHFERALAELAAKYAEFKRRRSIMDYDDLLLNLNRLLVEQPAIGRSLAAECRQVMVDEYQDTNSLQAEIADRLAAVNGNICVVGDDSQSIYSFRGANFRNIMQFPERHPGCKIIRLEQNYRSTEPILAFTNAIIRSARHKYDKTLFSQLESPQKPVFIEAASLEEQADFVAQRALELREEGVELGNIAVLFRAGWHSNELEVELAGRDIPFVKYGGLKFVEASHVKDMVSLLRVLQNPRDGIAWYRHLLLIEGVGPATGKKTVEKLLESESGLDCLVSDAFTKQKFAKDYRKLYELISELRAAGSTPEQAAEAVRSYYLPLLQDNYEDFRKRIDDLESIVRIAGRYRSMDRFLDDISLEPPERSQVGAEAEDKETERLVLSTIHSAKGLEWHSVFVISLVDGMLPSTKSLENEEDIEEERRLFYVACTRAQRNLYLLTPELSRTRGFSPISPGFSFSEPSRFLQELPDFGALTEQWSLDSESFY